MACSNPSNGRHRYKLVDEGNVSKVGASGIEIDDHAFQQTQAQLRDFMASADYLPHDTEQQIRLLLEINRAQAEHIKRLEAAPQDSAQNSHGRIDDKLEMSIVALAIARNDIQELHSRLGSLRAGQEKSRKQLQATNEG